MKTKSLYQLNIEELNTKLLAIMRKQFNLRMQASSGQLKQTHLLRQMRRDIARIKTIITKNMSGL